MISLGRHILDRESPSSTMYLFNKYEGALDKCQLYFWAVEVTIVTKKTFPVFMELTFLWKKKNKK